MKTKDGMTFEDLVEAHLGERLPQWLTGAFPLHRQTEETQGFVLRMLHLMKRSGYRVTAFNPHLIQWVSATVPGTLPGAWGGRIPPLTLPGRHKKLDQYVSHLTFKQGKGPCIFVDAGCGFPPATAADTAGLLTDWQVHGIDRSFACYVLYDADGHYACFDDAGRFLYFQALMNISGKALYADPAGAKKRFTRRFEELYPLLDRTDDAKSETVEKDGNLLIYNHIRDFETENLTFIESDVLDLKLPPVKVIRCMNVLVYFAPEIRERILTKAGLLLDDDGILIAGTNGLGIQTRYTIYRKQTGRMVEDEFAFGFDNIGHIVFMPFFSIHDNDPEAMLLAELAGILRNSQPFGQDFSRRQDELLNEKGICKRGADGFLHFSEEEITLVEYMKRNAMLWQTMAAEGYIDEAVDVLSQAGYDAWKNPVGDIAVRPPQ